MPRAIWGPHASVIQGTPLASLNAEKGHTAVAQAQTRLISASIRREPYHGSRAFGQAHPEAVLEKAMLIIPRISTRHQRDSTFVTCRCFFNAHSSLHRPQIVFEAIARCPSTRNVAVRFYALNGCAIWKRSWSRYVSL